MNYTDKIKDTFKDTTAVEIKFPQLLYKFN